MNQPTLQGPDDREVRAVEMDRIAGREELGRILAYLPIRDIVSAQMEINKITNKYAENDEILEAAVDARALINAMTDARNNKLVWDHAVRQHDKFTAAQSYLMTHVTLTSTMEDAIRYFVTEIGREKERRGAGNTVAQQQAIVENVRAPMAILVNSNEAAPMALPVKKGKDD